MTRMLGQFLERRERRRRENAWRNLDRQAGGVPDIAPIEDIHRRALDAYSRGGGDLNSLHAETALAMSRRLLAMGMWPEAFVHHRLYPAHVDQLASEWQRGRRWLALTSDRHRRALSIMRDSPGTPASKQPGDSTRLSRIGSRTAVRPTWRGAMPRRWLS